MNLRILPIVLLVSVPVMAQNRRLDSLQNLLKTLPQDTNRVNVNIAMFRSLFASDVKKAMPYAQAALQLSQKLHFSKGEANSYSNVGIGYDVQNDYSAALENFLKGLRIFQEMNFYPGIATIYNNMGNTYRREGDFDEALMFYLKSLAIKQRYVASDKIGIGHTLNNIAVIYDNKKDYTKALEYYLQALEIKREGKDKKSLAYALSNIGVFYLRLHQQEKCIDYQRKALPLFEETNEGIGVLNVYMILNEAYEGLQDFDKAITYGEKALELAKKIGVKASIAQVSGRLSNIYVLQKNYEKAFSYLSLQSTYLDSLDTDEDIRKFERLKAGHELEKKEMENRALLKDARIRKAELLALTKDRQIKAAELQLAELSLRQQTEGRQLEKLQFEQELGGKELENLKLLKDKQIKDTELQLKEAVIGRQQAWGIATGIIVLLLGALSVTFYRNYRSKRADNQLLNEQKESIQQQNERLEELNAIKDRLFSIVSHDFRSPLHSLEGIVGLLQNEALTPEETKVVVTQLGERLGITLHLLENLLHWAKTQMEGMSVHPTVFDVKTIADENVRLVQGQVVKKRIEISNEMTSRTAVYADKEMINLVIRNLVNNAVKFTKFNGKIAIRSSSNESFVHISIHDTGLGMTKENQERLFNTATAFTTVGTGNEKGTGLGLTLCKDFVVKNGGDIQVESEPGKGSIFTFSIPKHQS
ncbi:tetratricopeptide repeat-containing sensor histidine kinase [Cytophagaceae bacterium YF14B1]|uniref:histidine kinase n=1 Tax=Xanthocytophaga flava TaxID=3048013 RepID=A0AAE3QPA4_9BACT|nr:tetratricopeptide repeat-containing sensor histidine kinase [Xanthocytophaga flavus]MDJ1480988.1 tetratricopeptide repeat-containing sensor histidine kinase [Xanthocytophaga flavus]